MKTIILVLIIFANIVIYSQNVINGKITDEYGNPIEGVKVTVKNTDISVLSKKNGSYEIEMASDKKVLSFQKEGYNVKEVEVNKTTVNIIMTTNVISIFDLSLEELMNLKVEIASKVELTQRESPAIVSVITQEELKNSGCRDMIDVLRLIPGIEFGIDVQGVVSIIMRGNWAHEGKVLLMLDGIPLNELNYSTIQFGSRFSIDQIEKIELIRGPGSAIYGGYAELGVINIISKNPQTINGLQMGADYGQMTKTFARRNAHFSVGKKINDNFEFKFHLFGGQANRSDKIYTDVFGNSYDMTNQSKIEPLNFNFYSKIYDLNIKVFYENYKVFSRDFFDLIVSKDYSFEFKTIYFETDYNFKISNNFSIQPKISFKNSIPWHTKGILTQNSTDSLYYNFLNYHTQVQRIAPSLMFLYDFNQNINLIGGIEYYYDIARNLTTDSNLVFWTNSKKVEFQNISVFAQALIKSNIANITIGGRLEKHSIYNTAFAPRIAFTKVLDDLHFKLLFSGAFRSPSIENIDANASLDSLKIPNIRPEKLYTAELEMGYKISKTMQASVNIFHIIIKDPIVYFFDDITLQEGYINSTQTGSYGIEAEYRIYDKFGFINLNFSFYSSKNINKVQLYQVPNVDNMVLGAPQFKISLNSTFNISKNFKISPSFIFLSEKYAFNSYDNLTNEPIVGKLKPSYLANLYVSYENLFVKGLDVGLGVYDIFDTNYMFAQPYNSLHAPFPSTSREIMIKIKYNVNF